MEDQALPQIANFEIPKDGKDCFQIGEYTFNITESDFSIASFSHDFFTEIKAQLNTPQKAIGEELLSEDEEGLIALQFPCRGIHNNGKITGEFTLEEDKTNGPYFYLRKEGFHYSMDYFGKITFQDGWIGYNGYMKPSYADSPFFLVKIYKQFDYSKLNWEDYHFSSIAEIEGIDIDTIQYLSIERPITAEFPITILNFRQLKNLTIGDYQDYYSNTHAPLNEIPKAIGSLSRLESLSIINCSITTLPESMGKLKNLQTLNVSNCCLGSLPYSIFQLPKLMYIFADNNQITYIPNYFDAPKLAAISLNNNLIETLPEDLAKLPKLNSLKIEGNPLKSLPRNFNEVKGVEMNINDKRRLLDFEYRGADGKGIEKWDNNQFYAELNNSLLKPVEAIINKNKLKEYQSDLLALGKKTVGFDVSDKEDYHKIGNTRFGGMPDLPASIVYPTFKYEKKTYKYEFIAQINCQEIAHLQDYLPRTGMLYFFLSSLHFFGFEEEFKTAQVHYFDGENHELITGKNLKFKNKEYYDMMGESCYEGFKATEKDMVTFPYLYSYRSNMHIFKGRAEKYEKALETDEKLEDKLYDKFETPVQDLRKADFEINGYVFSQHESPELQAALSKKGEPQDWISLLKVSSQGDFQWCDAGEIAFVIHKSDLLKKDFSNIFCTIESS